MKIVPTVQCAISVNYLTISQHIPPPSHALSIYMYKIAPLLSRYDYKPARSITIPTRPGSPMFFSIVNWETISLKHIVALLGQYITHHMHDHLSKRETQLFFTLIPVIDNMILYTFHEERSLYD